MGKKFQDVSIIGRPDPDKVKAGSKPYTNRFFFPLSAAPPRRWNELLVQEWLYRIMRSPRHIWISSSELVIDCPAGELASIVERVVADIETVNRKYKNEVESELKKTDEEREQAMAEKRLDDASIRKAINELKLPN